MKSIFKGLGAAALGATLFAGIYTWKNTHSDTNQAHIITQVLTRQNYDLVWQAPGITIAANEVDVKVPYTAVVEWKNTPRAGQMVQEGQILASLNTDGLNKEIQEQMRKLSQTSSEQNKKTYELENLEHKFKSAQKLLQIAKQTFSGQKKSFAIELKLFENQKQLHENGATSETAFLNAQAKLRQAEANLLNSQRSLEQSKEHLMQAKMALKMKKEEIAAIESNIAENREQILAIEEKKKNAYIAAPIKGQIKEVFTRNEHAAKEGSAAVRIQSTDQMEFTCKIPANLGLWLYRGPLLQEEQPLKLQVLNHELKTEHLKAIEPATGGADQHIALTFSIENTADILPGAPGQLELPLAQLRNVFVVGKDFSIRHPDFLDVDTNHPYEYEVLYENDKEWVFHIPSAPYQVKVIAYR